MTDSWKKYRGDGNGPDGKPVKTRHEQGRYLADDALVNSVNTALAVERPLLVTGEPGTGKTMLAWSVAGELGMGDVLEFHTASDNRAADALYLVDNMRRFYDAQVPDPRAADIGNYIQWRALGTAIRASGQRVVLIDEIDKAPRDFPNDLLDVIDQMEFDVPELGKSFRYQGPSKPIVIITSNIERQLPLPFLRRCVFHRIEFPNDTALRKILHERLGELPERLVSVAIKRFLDLRAYGERLEKAPSTSELIMWTKVLKIAGVNPDKLEQYDLADLPHLGAVIKTEADERLLKGQAR
jgi:MoxR-like ATPase